ncbi:MAG: 3-hydroxyacyl-ACP dehydratase FabZ [Candidatus Omnitrophica bacterium]|nr:3-hydroxyacyl-ACP dehydratase FabZ [Candidatus Omnitrophota bacterium]
MVWDKEKIKTILPQREPFLFIDEVIEVEEGKRVVAKKYLDPAADFFKGHFPGNPVMPGVLTIEAMAQASIILFYTAKPGIAKTNPDYYLTNVNVTFKSPVYPGDTLILEACNFKIVDFGGVIDVTAKVGDRIAATMRGSFAVVAKKRKNGK